MIVPRKYDELSCNHCHGMGEVINQRLHQVKCPVCNGSGMKKNENEEEKDDGIH